MECCVSRTASGNRIKCKLLVSSANSKKCYMNLLLIHGLPEILWKATEVVYCRKSITTTARCCCLRFGALEMMIITKSVLYCTSNSDRQGRYSIDTSCPDKSTTVWSPRRQQRLDFEMRN
jgi:hypothetical protein